MRPSIIVVGLGPAGPELLGDAARRAIEHADVAFLRTRRHPAAASLGDLPSFDHHYEAAATFDQVYERIVADLVTTAQVLATGGGHVVYAVPGSPSVAERTVELLRADPRVDLVVVPALSFLDLAWDRLGVDPLGTGVRLVDGTRFEEQAAGERGPLLVAQCWSASVLSEVKLAFDDGDPGGADEPTVTVLHHLGLSDEVVATVPWHELDRAVVPDHLTSVWLPRPPDPAASELAALDHLVRRLRSDCPWDRQQTHSSLTRHLVEEAYEVVDAIDALGDAEAAGEPTREADAVGHLEEELGDLLFQVYFHARLAAESGRFTLADVARSVHAKLVARHPHVFGDVVAPDAGTVTANWEHIKKAEKGRASVTDGIPPALPALALSAKLQRKANAVPGMERPSLAEVRGRALAVLSSLPATEPDGSIGGAAIGRDDAGTLLWAVADVVRRLGAEPEEALRSAAMRFRDRVREAERAAPASGAAPAAPAPGDAPAP